MSQDERDAIRHTVGHLVGLAIEGVGADANSVTVDHAKATDEERLAAHKSAASARDAIRAGGNLLCGLLCDLNRLADANETMASPIVVEEAADPPHVPDAIGQARAALLPYCGDDNAAQAAYAALGNLALAINPEADI